MDRTSAWRRALVAAAMSCAVTVGTAPAMGAPVASGHSGWLWDDPAPQGETLDRVAFQGARGYASGRSSARSCAATTAGRAGSGCRAARRPNLTLLQEVDPDTVVVGGGCTVRESTDGGGHASTGCRSPKQRQGCATKVAVVLVPEPHHRLSSSRPTVRSLLTQRRRCQTLEPKTARAAERRRAPDRSSSPRQTVGFALVELGRRRARSTARPTAPAPGPRSAPRPRRSPGITFVTPAKVAYAVGGRTARCCTASTAARRGTPLPLALPAGQARPSLTQISCSDAERLPDRHGAGGQPSGRTCSSARTDGGADRGARLAVRRGTCISVAFSTPEQRRRGRRRRRHRALRRRRRDVPDHRSPRELGATLGDVRSRIGASPQDAYVPGRAGLIAATTDGGAELEPAARADLSNIRDVAFPTPSSRLRGQPGAAPSTGRPTERPRLVDPQLGRRQPRRPCLAPSERHRSLLVGPTGAAPHAPTRWPELRRRCGASVVLGHQAPTQRAAQAVGVPAVRGRCRRAGSAIIAWGDEAIESADGGRARGRCFPRPLAARERRSAVVRVNASTGYVVSLPTAVLHARSRTAPGRRSPRSAPKPSVARRTLSFSSVSSAATCSVTGPGSRTCCCTPPTAGRTWAPEALPRPVSGVAAAGAVDYAASAGDAGAFAGTLLDHRRRAEPVTVEG